MKKYVFGVDVGGTTVKMGLFDMNANVLEKWEIPSVTANGGERVLPDIAASIEEKLGQYEIEQDEVAGVGIGEHRLAHDLDDLVDDADVLGQRVELHVGLAEQRPGPVGQREPCVGEVPYGLCGQDVEHGEPVRLDDIGPVAWSEGLRMAAALYAGRSMTEGEQS